MNIIDHYEKWPVIFGDALRVYVISFLPSTNA